MDKIKILSTEDPPSYESCTSGVIERQPLANQDTSGYNGGVLLVSPLPEAHFREVTLSADEPVQFYTLPVAYAEEPGAICPKFIPSDPVRTGPEGNLQERRGQLEESGPADWHSCWGCIPICNVVCLSVYGDAPVR